MQVEAWMSRQVHTVRPLDSILRAREIMEKHRINQLPVVAGGKLVGIVTDRDLRDAFPSVFEPPTTCGKKAVPTDPKQIKVEMVMTPHVLTVNPKTSLAEAVKIMRRERIAALPVVEGTRVVGIITRSDVLDAFLALAESTATGGA